MMSKSFLEYTREEFLAMKNKMPEETFTDVIIVPTDQIHDSGFLCMKFILCKNGEIVGAVSGWSDVVHINGIGGYGKDFYKALESKKVDRVGWCIDCLPKSGCVRLFSDRECELRDPMIVSSFEFFVK